MVPVGEPVKLDQQPPAEADTTTLAFGQAEPGRDIFGDHPHNDLKSKEGQAPQKDAEIAKDKKVVSSQNVESVTETPTAASETLEMGTAETLKTGIVGSSSSTMAEISAAAAKEASSNDHDHAEGPKVQEEAEADRAREELFPDAKQD